ncbi:hypothetical protein QJS04_geneDACA016249 [Acorus gramineus]|uniref:Uncharacterized protein n=1 Tax=Acorus gramineus TaxID=55184 RepID=A0AAV9AH18_ACOGR|nr:hypothetical protein QJS04_geneDACA016249 [Acorus gramineus]
MKPPTSNKKRIRRSVDKKKELRRFNALFNPVNPMGGEMHSSKNFIYEWSLNAAKSFLEFCFDRGPFKLTTMVEKNLMGFASPFYKGRLIETDQLGENSLESGDQDLCKVED